jgi:hypothetical protein
MISLLSGFFTIFIGVFMVNDAKSSNASLLSKHDLSHISMHSLERVRSSVHVPKLAHGKFHLLKTFDEDAVYHSEDEMSARD